MSRKKKAGGDGEEPAGPQAIEFDSDDLRYDPAEFMVPGKDDHGASTRQSFSLPPTMERQLEVIIAEKTFPYKTTSDIIRHAVYRHLLWLQKMEPQMPKHILSGLEAIMEVVRDSGMRSRLEDTFKAMDGIVSDRIIHGDSGEALRVLTLAKQKLLKMPDSRWKQHWLEVFSTKYASRLSTDAEAEAANAEGYVAVDNVVEFPSPEE